jgi:DNA-binding transcriptional regulator YhcF (GntR family)
MMVPQIANALKKEERFETLLLFDQHYTLSEIADELDMSFAGIQAYTEDLEDAQLVEKVESHRVVTELGELVIERFMELEEELESRRKEMIKSNLAQGIEEAREQGLSDEEIEELL